MNSKSFDRVLVACLFGIVAFAPHSIAATQTMWVAALVIWVAKLGAVWLSNRAQSRAIANSSPSIESSLSETHDNTSDGRFDERDSGTNAPARLPLLSRTPVDYALLGFFAFTILSAFFSYEPIASLGKLRGVSLFTILYLFVQNIVERKTLRRLIVLLIVSCALSVVYVCAERAWGRGVKVEGVRVESPLYVAGVRSGDTILEVNGVKLRDAVELEEALLIAHDRSANQNRSDGRAQSNIQNSSGSAVSVRIYRYEWMPTLEVRAPLLLDGATTEERLGIASWTHGRDWRAAGLYGHYTTYAEVLQLIMSLAVGLFVALPRKLSPVGVLLALATVGMGAALLLTVTRASWLGLFVAVIAICCVWLKSARLNRRVVVGGIVATALIVLLVAPVALNLLQQKRNVGFLDRSDGSITWRETVYREGVGLFTQNARHFLVGVGMDSIKRHAGEWRLFDNGKLPPGHMHSTPLQLAVERGVFTLLAWLCFLFVYLLTLWRTEKRLIDVESAGESDETWFERGVVLGAFGGAVGFFTSGVVHYNLGDSEVATVFYIIAGLALACYRMVERQS